MASRPSVKPRAAARRVKPLPTQQYQLRIELKHVEPLVWRRILVPQNVTLQKLHPILLWTMGWQGGHLHEFEIARLRYGMPPDEDWPDNRPVLDESRFRLSGFVDTGLRRFKYVYDFGDHWEHAVAFEGVQQRDLSSPPVTCLAGENACPPEDVGGPPGYAEFLAAISDATHEEHAQLLQWVGGSFDSAAFDLAGVNQRLAEIKA
jgi:hypothetical protein